MGTPSLYHCTTGLGSPVTGQLREKPLFTTVISCSGYGVVSSSKSGGTITEQKQELYLKKALKGLKIFGIILVVLLQHSRHGFNLNNELHD